MSRAVLVSVLAALAATAAVGCSKSAGSKEGRPPSAADTQEAIAAPGPVAPAGANTAVPAGGARGAREDAFKLKPEEGELAIEVPPDAVAGKETVARVMVTPTPKYKINFEYDTRLSLQPGEGVTLTKAEFKAGGMAKSQGDAEKFEEKKLEFAVKLTPKAAGSHTVSGMFKFAVCDKDTCLAKKEAIAIKLAAK